MHHWWSNTTDPNIGDHFVSVKMAPPFCDCETPCKVSHFRRKFYNHLRPAKPLICLLQIKLHLPVNTVLHAYSVDFTELWNPQRKTVPGQFRNCLQDRGNFHRSRACQIVFLIFITAPGSLLTSSSGFSRGCKFVDDVPMVTNLQ